MDKFVPGSVLVKLVKGQRVRYVPVDGDDESPELGSLAAQYGATCHEAQSFAEGKTGIIYSSNSRQLTGRPFLVVMDEPYQFGGQARDGICIGAHELALVEDE